MNPHLRRAWATLAARPNNTRLIHIELPDDPYEAHHTITTLAQGGRTAVRHTAAEATPYDHARIHDLVRETEGGGGFSNHPAHGSPPGHGFMASYEAPEGSGISQEHDISEIQPEHIAEHRQSIAHHLSQPDSYQGGWLDKGEGKVYLDASRRFPEESDVRQFSLDNKQKAYFDLSNFDETFLHPKLDPLAMKDPEAWKAHYEKHGYEPPEQYHSYSHLYPPTDDQKKFWGEQGHHLAKKDEQKTAAKQPPGKPAHLAGRPVGPWMNEGWVSEQLRKRHGL